MDVHEPGAEMTVSRHLYTQNLEDKERYHSELISLYIILEKINTIVLQFEEPDKCTVFLEKRKI